MIHEHELPASRRRLLVFAVAAFSAVHLVRVFTGHVLVAAPVSGAPQLQAFQVDLNRGSLAELATLPGVGPQRAAAIVLHRVRNGPFRRVEDLDGVEGIGAALVAAIRPHLAPVASSQ